MKICYKINQNICTFCAGCSSVCPQMAIQIYDNCSEINPAICTRCGNCLRFCPVNAVEKSTG